MGGLIEEALRTHPQDNSLTAGMVRGALQQYGLAFEVPGLVGAYRAEYNTWLKNRKGSLDQDALTYAVVHMNQTRVVWKEARKAKYPR